MRSICLSLFLAVSLTGCGEKKPSPPKPAPNTTTTSAPKSPTEPASLKPVAAPPASTQAASTSTSAPTSAASSSAPTSMAAIKPWLELPTALPDEGTIEYEEWLKIKDLPAVSEDGKVIASLSIGGYDERDEVGDTVSLTLFNTETNDVEKTIDLLLPKETYEDAPVKIRSKLLKNIAPRIEAAQKVLEAHKWLPMEPIGEQEQNIFAIEGASPFKISFKEDDGNLVVIEADGKKVKEQKFPKWAAPPSRPCKEDELLQMECDCDFPIIIQEASYNAQLRLAVLSINYIVSHTCESSPGRFQVAIRY